MRYSITLSSFRKLEPIEETLPKLVRQGYDAVEMYGEPEVSDLSKLKDVFSTNHLIVCGITGMWGSASSNGWKRLLLSSNQDLARTTVRYVQDCVKMCNSLGGKEMNICLFADDLRGFDRTHTVLPDIEKEKFRKRAVPILSELCRFATDNGVQLVLEPLNRYSTPYCSSAKDAINIVREVNNESLRVLLDTFHMNIEEDSFEQAIRMTGSNLKHTHFADNNRKMPGFAHIDFTTIVKSLHEIGYDGYISFEPNIADKNYEQIVNAGLGFIKSKVGALG
jgi:D-psicose/D-tagatose/L-ribulose 3-epimerase